jgi:hypothetical protein
VGSSTPARIARQHVRPLVPLEHDARDPRAVQDLAEQQAGRAAADDGHLGVHALADPGGSVLSS